MLQLATAAPISRGVVHADALHATGAGPHDPQEGATTDTSINAHPGLHQIPGSGARSEYHESLLPSDAVPATGEADDF